MTRPLRVTPLVREALAVVGGFTVLTLAMTYPLAREITRGLPGGLGDPLLNIWTLAWDADRLRHGLQGLWDAPIFYPYPNTLAYSEHLLGIAVLTAPVQWLSGNPLLAYNVAFLMSSVLAGSGMYLLTVSLTGSRLAAVVAGVAFGFLPFRVAQLGHLQVLMYGWMPIGLWALHRFFGSGSKCALAAFSVVFLLQGLSNSYYLYFFALPIVAVIAFELWRRPEHRLQRMAHLGLAGALTLLALAPVIATYYEVRSDQALVRSREDIVWYSARVDSYLEGSRSLRLWGDTLSSAGPETDLFPGLGLVVLAALGLGSVAGIGLPVARAHAPRDHSSSARSVAWLYAGIGTVALLLTLGPEPTAWGHRLPFSGPYAWLLAVVPGLDGLRVPARLVVVVYLALAVLAAIGMAAVVTRLSRRSGVLVVLLVSAVLVAEGYGGPMPVTVFEPHLALDDQRAYAWLRAAPPGGVLELPIRGNEPGDTLTFQYATLQHTHPIVNGYSGYSTGLFSFLSRPGSPLFEHEQLDDVLRACRALGIRYVVVHAPFFDLETARPTISATIRRSQDQLLAIKDFDSTVVFWLAEPDPLVEAPPNLRRVPVSRFTATASHQTRDLDQAFDDDLNTGWRSGNEQTGTEWIELRLDHARNLGLVRFDMADGGIADYPRSLVIMSSDGVGPFKLLYQGDVVTQLTQGLVHGRVPQVGSTPIEIVLPENDTTRLRIRQTGQTGDWAWSIDELSIWER